MSTKSVQNTLHNQLALYSLLVMLLDHLKTKLGGSITYKHVFNLRTFQSKWLLINLVIVTFLIDYVHLKDKCITLNVQIQIPRNLVEMCFTKYSSICKNLSFIWFLDCYQILYLPTLLHAENCCTIADKITPKPKHLLSNSYKICRESYTISLKHAYKFQANPSRFDHSNMVKIIASSDFQ